MASEPLNESSSAPVRGGAATDKRTLSINALCNWLSFGASIVIAFVMCPVLVRGLGDQRYGVWSLVEAAVGWFALLDMGIGASVVRYVAKFEATEERDQLNRVFSTTLCIFLGAAAVTLAGCSLLAWFWTQPFGLPPDLALVTRRLFVLLGACVAAELVVGVFGAVLYGLGRFPARVAIEVPVRVATAVALYLAIRNGGGLMALASLSLGAILVKGMLQIGAARWYLPGLRFSPKSATWDTFRTIRGYSFRVFIAMIAGRVSFKIDALVIGAFLAPEYITYFVVAARLVDYAKNAVSSLVMVLTPAVSALESRGDWAAIRRAFVDGSRYVLWLAIPIQLGLILFGKPFFTLWLSAEHAEQAYPVLVVLSLPLVIALPGIVGSRILYGTGELRGFTWLSVLQAMVNLAISVLLVRRYGIMGVAVGTAVPMLLYFVAIDTLVCRHCAQSILAYCRAAYLPTLLPGFVLWVAWAGLRCLLPPDTWQGLFVIGSGGAALYGMVVVLWEFRRRANCVAQVAWKRAVSQSA